jgi:hypothetical protein
MVKARVVGARSRLAVQGVAGREHLLAPINPRGVFAALG